MGEVTTFIGLDVHKATVSVGTADAGRTGEVRFLGAIPIALQPLRALSKS